MINEQQQLEELQKSNQKLIELNKELLIKIAQLKTEVSQQNTKYLEQVQLTEKLKGEIICAKIQMI